MAPEWLTEEMVEVVRRAQGYTWMSELGKNVAIQTIAALAADPAFCDAVIRARVAEIQEVPGPRSWMYGYPHMKLNGAWCHSSGILTALGVTTIGTGGRDVTDDDGPLKESQVEWVVNDLAELGVKIKGQFFWCYKGRSLTYGAEESGGGIALHDDGTPMHWRPVWNREFGECVHPLNYRDPTKYGTVSLEDSDEWKTLPAPPPKGGER